MIDGGIHCYIWRLMIQSLYATRWEVRTISDKYLILDTRQKCSMTTLSSHLPLKSRFKLNFDIVHFTPQLKHCQSKQSVCIRKPFTLQIK